jgi:hypothetical protein
LGERISLEYFTVFVRRAYVRVTNGRQRKTVWQTRPFNKLAGRLKCISLMRRQKTGGLSADTVHLLHVVDHISFFVKALFHRG